MVIVDVVQVYREPLDCFGDASVPGTIIHCTIKIIHSIFCVSNHADFYALEKGSGEIITNLGGYGSDLFCCLKIGASKRT
jgi:hypothetical protein